MTIREMAEVAGVSPETVRAKAKEMYPDKFMKGKKTVFNQLDYAEAEGYMPQLVAIAREIFK